MNIESTIANHKSTRLQRSFQEAWYLKLNDPITQRALWLRFTLLSSRNGFKRVAETWAVYFHRGENREVKKVAIKQSYDLQRFSATDKPSIQIGGCELLPDSSHGSIQSRGNSIQWDLTFSPGTPSTFNLVPKILEKIGFAKNSVSTLYEDLMFSGTTTINGETVRWNHAPGMQGHLHGVKSAHSWVWGHCNTFLNEHGKPTDFVFEGLSARVQVGPVIAPKLSSFFFFYRGENYYFNHLKDAISIKSKNTLNEWEFQADRNDLSFRGYAKAEYKDFAGLTYEDISGSLLYCSNSKLSDMRILIYRNGKLEATFNAISTAAFELVSREKNPYVPILI